MKKFFGHEKIRFVIAGGLNTGLDFILLNTFVFLFGAIPLIANVLSVCIGICISYILNHYFVFRLRDKLNFKKFIMFFVVTGFSSLIIQSLIIASFETFFNTDFSRSLFIVRDIAQNDFLELNVAKVVAVLIGMVWNFMMYKHVIFKVKSRGAEKTDIEIKDLV